MSPLRPSLPSRMLLVCAVALGSSIASADAPSARDKQRAAAAFDKAVQQFNRAEFDEAARGFLEADRLAPSATAITNAIAAARRANDHLFVARAAERAIARGDALVDARAALAEAATRLARLELSCETTEKTCSLTLDGEAAAAGTAWALPGTHRIAARAGGTTAEEHVACTAGATYRLALRPKAAAPAPKPLPARSGIHRAVFFSGLGATAVLAGVTIWSGVDAIAAKRALPRDEAEQTQLDDVLGRARRTDWLLLGTGIAAVGTAVIGVWLTDWRGASATATVVPAPGGATFAAIGRFRGL